MKYEYCKETLDRMHELFKTINKNNGKKLNKIVENSKAWRQIGMLLKQEGFVTCTGNSRNGSYYYISDSGKLYLQNIETNQPKIEHKNLLEESNSKQHSIKDILDSCSQKLNNKQICHLYFLLLGGTCKGCDCREFDVIDWDHINRDTKENNISLLKSHSNKKDLIKELYKCQPLCANCHRIKTNKENMNLKSWK